MKCLVDTNVVLRAFEHDHDQHEVALRAMYKLLKLGFELCLARQSVYEFWVVTTRPIDRNGRGKSSVDALVEVGDLTAFFTEIEESPRTYSAWLTLVTTHSVLGKNANDARFVAAMTVDGISHILTFNDRDFRRFPGIKVMTPAEVLAAEG